MYSFHMGGYSCLQWYLIFYCVRLHRTISLAVAIIVIIEADATIYVSSMAGLSTASHCTGYIFFYDYQL